MNNDDALADRQDDLWRTWLRSGANVSSFLPSLACNLKESSLSVQIVDQQGSLLCLLLVIMRGLDR